MDEYGRGGADRPTDLSTHAAASWLHRAAEDLAARINKRGMTLTAEDAETILAERHSTIARQLGIGDLSVRSYFDSPGLDDLADRLVATFADEQPGADLFSLPRSAHVSVAGFGLLIAGLAEALLFYQHDSSLDAADRRARMSETTQLLSLGGTMQAGYIQSNITAPPALLVRIARTLSTVADLTDDTELAAALRGDAMRARTAAL